MKDKNIEKELNKNMEPAVLFSNSGIGTRINAICGLVGGKNKLAKMADVSSSQIHRYIAGDSEPKLSAARAIAKAGNVTVEWLASGKESDAIATTSVGDGAFAYIPLYDVTAAAGLGTVVNGEKIIDSLAFSKEWIKNKLNLQPRDLYLINVVGESMEPTLGKGDVILIDHTDTSVGYDGIYVLRIGDSLLVKRLQRLPNTIIKVSSDNPAYQSFDIDLSNTSDNEVSIIGRAVWSGRRI